jgi:hypothetical protein
MRKILQSRILTKIYLIIISFGLILFSFGCQSSESTEGLETNTKGKPSPSKEEKVSVEKVPAAKFVDVPNLANKSGEEFDKIFGKPLKITPIEDNPAMMPGEYREYQVEGHPKNLSVRFYKDKAKRFNLLLGTPLKSSEQALSEIFKVDVKNKNPDTKTEPLSEKWKGNFSGVNFVTLYAKREKPGGDFTMLHAEIDK